MTSTATTCWPQRDLHTRRRPSRLTWVLGSLAMLAISAMSKGWAAELTLVNDGEPTAVVVLPVEADKAEQQAANELVEHIALISGAELSVIRQNEPTRGLTPIRIGTAADASLDTVIQKQGDDPAAFALLVNDSSVQLRGLSPVGSRAAAYELLEQLGVRWYMPGEIGRVVPKDRTVTLARQKTVQVPSFEGRRGVGKSYGRWHDRLRLGGTGRYGAHGIHPFSGSARQAAFEANPEFFGLVDGQRRSRQLCLTNSTSKIEENQVLKQVVAQYRQVLRESPDLKILNMGPNDGGGYCECDHCRALDPSADHTTPLADQERSRRAPPDDGAALHGRLAAAPAPAAGGGREGPSLRSAMPIPMEAPGLDKPDGFVVVDPQGVQEFLDPLPVDRLWGVGRQTSKVFQRLRVRTIAELRQLLF